MTNDSSTPAPAQAAAAPNIKAAWIPRRKATLIVYEKGALKVRDRPTGRLITNSDGVVKTGLSVMSFHTRLSAIGRNKPRRDGEKVSESYRSPRSAPANRLPASGGAPWDDDIGL